MPNMDEMRRFLETPDLPYDLVRYVLSHLTDEEREEILRLRTAEDANWRWERFGEEEELRIAQRLLGEFQDWMRGQGIEPIYHVEPADIRNIPLVVIDGDLRAEIDRAIAEQVNQNNNDPPDLGDTNNNNADPHTAPDHPGPELDPEPEEEKKEMEHDRGR